MEWTEQAACKNELKEMFFCDSLDNKINSNRQVYAKSICRKCPVAAECLMYAIGNKESFGIWGSFAPKERNVILNLFSRESLVFKMEEDMGLSFDATITAIDAKKKFHMPIMIKKDIEKNEDENEMDIE